MLRPSALLDAQVHALADFCALQALADQAADGYATHIDHTHGEFLESIAHVTTPLYQGIHFAESL